MANLSQYKMGRPNWSAEEVTQHIAESYGLTVSEVTSLDSYDGQTFLVQTISSDMKLITGNKLVFKIRNAALSEHLEGFRSCFEMMTYLHDHGMNCPSPVLTTNEGMTHTLVKSKNEHFDNANVKILGHVVSLQTYVPGMVLGHLKFVPENLCEEWGEMLGKFHISLKTCGINNEHAKALGEELVFSLDHVERLIEMTHMVENDQRRKMVEEIITYVSQEIVNEKENLPQGFIHNDFNENNITVTVPASSCTSDPVIHISGLFDFDEANYSSLVYDVGITLVYVLLCKSSSKDKSASLFLKGYGRYRCLNNKEFECLYTCVVGRLAQSLVIGLYANSLWKDPYLVLTQERGWDLMEELWTYGREEIYRKWNFSI